MDDVRGDVKAMLDVVHARLIMRGTDFSDVARVRAKVEDWDGWWDAWEELAQYHLGLRDSFAAQGFTRAAGEAEMQAGLALHWEKAIAVVDDERYRDVTRRSVEAIRNGVSTYDPSFERIEVPFDGHYVVGNLRRPAGVERPPLVLLVPGTESVKEEFPRWEEAYLARGAATMSIDGPGQGEVGFNLRIRHDYEAPVAALLDALEGREDLDLDRVGAAGVSLGGYYVIRAAAFEKRLKAVLNNCGSWNLAEAYDEAEAVYRQKWIWNLGAADVDEGRELAGKLDLEGVAQQVEVPALTIFGGADKLLKAETNGPRTANAMPQGELWTIEGGNHGVTNYVSQQLHAGADWMLSKL